MTSGSSRSFILSDMKWKVVPLSRGQLHDVRDEDILDNGQFRKCETYRGGGGYDQFPKITNQKFGHAYHQQFIVQLFGCNLDCPYCYVTRAGVWGRYVEYSTEELIEAFKRSGQEVFHLMGGAPALVIEHWHEIIYLLPKRVLFHSDMMLTEKDYDIDVLSSVRSPIAMLAVNVKGVTPEEHLKNTRKPLNEDRFWNNLHKISEIIPNNFYITFTNVTKENQELFWKKAGESFTKCHQDGSFAIDLIDYDALPFVDEVPWGGNPFRVASVT
jgi:uncharacterized Fe-S cluster-containing radical SAM superfamily protein